MIVKLMTTCSQVTLRMTIVASIELQAQNLCLETPAFTVLHRVLFKIPIQANSDLLDGYDLNNLMCFAKKNLPPMTCLVVSKSLSDKSGFYGFMQNFENRQMDAVEVETFYYINRKHHDCEFHANTIIPETSTDAQSIISLLSICKENEFLMLKQVSIGGEKKDYVLKNLHLVIGNIDIYTANFNSREN